MRQLKVYGAPIEHAPSVFRAELAGWVKFVRVPDNELLAAIIRNDLGRVIALTNETSWPLVRDTMRWLWAFAPHLWTPGTDFTELERQVGQLRGENAELKAKIVRLRDEWEQ